MLSKKEIRSKRQQKKNIENFIKFERILEVLEHDVMNVLIEKVAKDEVNK